MKHRVITGAAFALVILICIALQGWAFNLLILFGSVVALKEMYGAYRNAGSSPLDWCGYAGAILVFVLYTLRIYAGASVNSAVSPEITGILFGVMAASAAVIAKGRIDYDKWAKTVLPLLYPGLFFSVMYGFGELSGWYVRAVSLILAFFIASINDVFAMLVGVRFGKHRFSGEISPKKSVEGSIAGLLASIVFSIAIPALMDSLSHLWPALNPDHSVLPPLWCFALLGLAGGMASQLGDLVASLVKRHCGIKDYSSIFPGHGGMMDRMDGILFCASVCLLFFKLA